MALVKGTGFCSCGFVGLTNQIRSLLGRCFRRKNHEKDGISQERAKLLYTGGLFLSFSSALRLCSQLSQPHHRSLFKLNSLETLINLQNLLIGARRFMFDYLGTPA